MKIITQDERYLVIECQFCKQIYKVEHKDYIEPFPHSNCKPTVYYKGGEETTNKFKKGNKHGWVHGHAGKHADKKGRTVEYHTWENFYKGGKSNRWKQYTNFLEDLGKKPSSRYGIRRLDTSKVHSRGNTIWSTANVRRPATSSEWTTKSIDVIIEKNENIDLENYISHE